MQKFKTRQFFKEIDLESIAKSMNLCKGVGGDWTYKGGLILLNPPFPKTGLEIWGRKVYQNRRVKLIHIILD